MGGSGAGPGASAVHQRLHQVRAPFIGVSTMYGCQALHDVVDLLGHDQVLCGKVAVSRGRRRRLPRMDRATKRLVSQRRRAGEKRKVAETLASRDSSPDQSIVQRGPGALGYTIQQPEEDRYLWSRQEILDKLVVLLGGRVAEDEVVGDLSTGAQNDPFRKQVAVVIW